MIIALVTYPTNPTNLICHLLAQRGCIIMLFKNGDFSEFVWKNIIRHIKMGKKIEINLTIKKCWPIKIPQIIAQQHSLMSGREIKL